MSVTLVTGSDLSEEEVAAVVIAVEMLISTRPALEESRDVTPAWRFSGRWFNEGRRLD